MPWLFPPVNYHNCRRYDDRFSERPPIFDKSMRERPGRIDRVMALEASEATLAQPTDYPGSAPIGNSCLSVYQ
jgi:hypothetical protein